MLYSLTHLLSLVGEYDVIRELLAERSDAGLRSWADLVPVLYLAVNEPARVDELVDVLAEVRPFGEFGRAIASFGELIKLGRAGASREVRELQQEALDLFVVDSSFWFGALQQGMSAELVAGNVAEALEMADIDLDHAYRVADRSAMILPLACYATALRQLGDAPTAALVRGSLPRRLTILFVEELVELDTWLAEQLDEPTRRELAARGVAMEPRELRDLARSVITQP